MFRNLKIWQKLVLMSIVFLIPFAVVTMRLITSVNKLGIEGAEEEIAGTEYNIPVRKLLEDLQQRRGFAQVYLSGDLSYKSKFEAKNGDILTDVKAIDDGEKRIGSVLRTRSRWSALKDKCVQFIAAAPATNASESFKKHTAVIAEVLALHAYVVDVSNLILDPDMDSYYLMDVDESRAPELVELLAQARDMSYGFCLRKTLTDPERRELIRLATLIDYNLKGMGESFEKAAGKTPELKSRLEEYVRANQSTANQFLDLLNTRVLSSGPISAPAVNAFDTATRSMAACYSLYDHATPALADLLRLRIRNLMVGLHSTLLYALAGLLAVCLVGFFIIRDITRPLQATVQVAERISMGDLNLTLPSNHRRDEVGSLAHAFTTMVQSLQDIAGAAEQIAAGDLTVEISPKSERDMMGNTLATMVRNLRQETREILEGVNVLAAASSEILAATTQLASGAAETSAAVSETTTTAEEVRQTAQVSNQKANHVSETANKAEQTSRVGKQSTEETIGGMNRVREQMESIAESILRLSEQSQTIAEIVASVNDLAEQSNLLAVNATIEAAKSGEQGKGFAVVAQEIRGLAEQSKQATAQIRAILNDIQKATNAAVMVTEQGTKVVDAGVEQSTRAGEAIQKLGDSIAEAAHAAMQIAASSKEELVGIEHVVLAMENIKQTSAQNVDSTRQVESAARNLHELGQKLKDVVERYKV